MIRHFPTFLCLCLLAAGFSSPVHAETLDDAGIGKFYADSATLVRQPEKLKPFMEAHLDEGFTVQQNITQTVDNGAPQTSTASNGKSQVIASAMQMAQTMKIEMLENKVVSIKYSDDHQLAYVTDTTATSGTASSPSGGAPLHYKEGESCVDALALKGGVIQLVKSVCNDQITVTK